MTDLSKLPWDECVLPEFRGRQVRAGYNTAIGYVYIWVDCFGMVASTHDDTPIRWAICRGTIDELELILRMCRQVETFIKEHGG